MSEVSKCVLNKEYPNGNSVSFMEMNEKKCILSKRTHISKTNIAFLLKIRRKKLY